MTWNDEAEKWIELARGGHDPNPADTERVRRALVARGVIVAGGVAGTVATTAGAAASAVTVKALVVQASAALLVAGSVATATTLLFDSTSQVAPAPSNASAAATSPASGRTAATSHGRARSPDPPPAAGEAPDVNEGEPSGRSRAGAPLARRAPPASRVSGGAADANTPGAWTPATRGSAMTPALEREIAGLRSAQQALHRGQTESAARALDKLEETSPEGAMLEERLATRTILACTTGNEPDALARFLARYPASVHRERVLAACPRKPAVGRFPETGSTGRDH